MFVILFYDIAQKEKDNSRKIRKTVERYLPRVQYSVYEGEIRASDLKKLKAELKEACESEDSVIIYEFERPSHTRREVIGLDKNEGPFS
jgi:CRISPR-associated protein Cas2